MTEQIRSLKKLAKWYFILLGSALLLILSTGFITDPQIGPALAVLGIAAGLVANIIGIFVLPIKALALK